MKPESLKLTGQQTSGQATVVVLDQYGGETESEGLTWKSGDDSIATVDASGTITAHSSGKTEISASIGNLRGEVPVTVDIYASGEVAPPYWMPAGSERELKLSVKDDKGQNYTADKPVCTSDSPTVLDIADNKLVAKGTGVATITCAVAGTSFGSPIAVMSPGAGAFAHEPKAIDADFASVRGAIAGIPQVKQVGNDKVKLIRFQMRRGSQKFFYEFCGTKDQLELSLVGPDGTDLETALTGPCKGKTFPDDAMPWAAAAWMPMLAEADKRGIEIPEKATIEITAAKPEDWTLKGGGRTLLASKAGVIP